MVRIDDSGSVTKCWLLQEELDDLERVAFNVDWERDVAMQLMGRRGLRADEVPYLSDSKFRWSDQGECWHLEVRGKNTRSGPKATRDA